MNVRYGLLVILVMMLAVITKTIADGALSADTREQTQRGSSISVIVNNALGSPLSNASVTVTDEDDQVSSTITTKDENGFYYVPVQPGDYQVEAMADGFKSDTQSITVRFGESPELIFNLEKE